MDTDLSDENRGSHGEGQEPDEADDHVGVATSAQVLGSQREQYGDVPALGGYRSHKST